MIAGLHFDDASHTYTLDGRKVPGVTTVLRLISAHEYRCVDTADMVRGALIGKAVHKVIELDIDGTLDEDHLSKLVVCDQPVFPYLKQWRKFVAQSGFRPILSETQVCSRRYGYAGTLDIVGYLNDRLALIDAKRTESLPKIAGPQTAGYEIALLECDPRISSQHTKLDRYALRIEQ